MKTIGILIGNNQSEYIKSLMDEFESQSKKLGIRLIFLSGYKVPSEYNEEDEFDDWIKRGVSDIYVSNDIAFDIAQIGRAL